MKLKELRLRNFRNWEEVTFQPGDRLNFIFGNNGQGKTSLVEAIGILASLRSFRQSKLEDWVRHGSNHAEILAVIAEESAQAGFTWETQLKVLFQQEPFGAKFKKSAFINGKPYKSALGYLSQRYGSVGLGFHCVIFNPADHDLIRGDPSYRRSVIDRIISAENLDHLKDLQRYQKALDQKNAALKTEVAHKTPLLLKAYEDQMVESGSRVAGRRLTWFQKALPQMRKTLAQIAPNQSEITIEFKSKWLGVSELKTKEIHNLNEIHFSGQGSIPSIELLQSRFEENLSRYRKIELQNHSSMIGPHRDDWQFTLRGNSLSNHGSQGEIRSVLLALKLSEVEQFREACGHLPLFLLDDFSSELDELRRSYLLSFLESSGLQVFITTTDPKISGGRTFEIANGICKERVRESGEFVG